jgi:hypothetical protein
MTHRRTKDIDNEMIEIALSLVDSAKTEEFPERLPRDKFPTDYDFAEYEVTMNFSDLLIYMFRHDRNCIEDDLLVDGVQPYDEILVMAKKLLKSAKKADNILAKYMD